MRQYSIDNDLLQKYHVKYFKVDADLRDIIHDSMEEQSNDDPFFLIDLGEINKAYSRWKDLLPDVRLYYAIKCNPNMAILETLATLGANFDCASRTEIETILDITNDPSRIIFANPCKMPSHIRYAKKNNVDLMTFDCQEELYKIKLDYPSARLLLRLAVDDSKSVWSFNCKFGCAMGGVHDLLKISKELELEIVGFSFHVGSGCYSAESYYDAIGKCRIATDIAKKLGIEIKMIDIGGGFPGADFFSTTFADVATSIDRAIHDFFGKGRSIQFIAEPGRYIVQKSHVLVLQIIGKKTSREENMIIYYINDGIYSSFNCIIFDNCKPIIHPLNKKEGKLFRSKIFGRTCDSIDKIVDPIMLPDLAIGDRLYVENFGAYTVASASCFNGFEKPVNKYFYRI